ncbi:putative membrane protein YvbJ [Salirhabdus euzebyi]|uniref:Putative membrane protein YvbJ n=1 Tax=Salirhabdus euzebyi TaxID=394506 RepID=A0A841Q889_9BACI|nr:zinc-ribbon domain-containing protein [Salirhabdus euzebyi]MBB6454616.1 putative membrane protein YvbJ [Salirhabdus euzebyi]
MNFCRSCGSKLDTEKKFCIHCGAPLENGPTDHYSELSSQELTTYQRTKRKPLSKATKIFLTFGIGLILALVITHQILSSHYDPMKDLQAMDQALATNSIQTLNEYIEFDDSAILDEESYFEYIKDVEWEVVKEQYTKIIKEPTDSTSTIASSLGAPLYYVKNEPILFGLYNQFSLEAVPSELKVVSALDDTQIKIENISTTIGVNTSTTIADIYPGTFTLSGTANNDFGEFQYEDTITIQAITEVEKAIEFPIKNYAINTNVPEADLFLNDQPFGIKLSAIDQLGPFPVDSSSILHAQWRKPNGEVIQSSSVNVKEYATANEIPLMFAESDLVEEKEVETASTTEEQGNHEAAGQYVLDFRNAYEIALNRQDFSYIEPYLLDGSHVDEDLHQYIKDLMGSTYHYDFESNTVLDSNIIDNKTAKITTRELFTYTTSSGEKIYYDKSKVYTVIYENGVYQITYIEYTDTDRTYN